MKAIFIRRSTLRLLVSLLGGVLLTGCVTREMGVSRCLNLSSWQDRADCQAQNKRMFDEYDKLQKPEPVLEKDAAVHDPVCYVNAGKGEKPCTK